MAQVTDPRERRGRVHPLPFVLALAVLAVTAGARTSLENAEQSVDLDQRVLRVLGWRRWSGTSSRWAFDWVLSWWWPSPGRQAAAVDGKHTSARFVAAARAVGAFWLLPVKHNSPALHRKPEARPWGQVRFGARSRQDAHGRRETRTLKVLALNQDDATGLLGAAQVVRVRRHWGIENKLHHVHDTMFDEDRHRARTGNLAAVHAVLRNTALNLHRATGAG